ncbi:DNA-binding protein [Xanthomonas arboricola]|uniref:DNA-binding protein n=1 Tax=Xanthomonas arboricola TaxID=56448 RepID=UPI0025AEDC4A|nr:DNA-binding protein [Xanthomonas arboricola]MDN0209388.1 DNA-binding protein [Xanthomonas arboricola pv. corylina]MDN0213781.1 DNA-binding protein [Xanthomonas arboricola pv. corylina]
MDPSQDARDRIFKAADALYDQAGREVFPTVDAVRKAAKVNMNEASTVMKEWRRTQARPAPAAVQVPETVQLAAGTAVGAIWQAAQEAANDALRAAQAGWEAERQEAEALSQQMADAYEAQALELEAAQARIAELDTAMQQAASAAVAHQAAFDQVRTELMDLQQRASTAEARASELRTELDRAHLVAAEQRNAAGQAREDAANLRGRLAAFESVATSPTSPKAGQAKPRGRGAS